MNDDVMSMIARESESMEQDSVPTGDMSSTLRLANRMSELKAQLDRFEEWRKNTQAEYDNIRQHLLPEAMKQAGLIKANGKGSFTLASGEQIFLRSELFASVKKEDEQKYFDWLRQSGNAGVIKETVHYQTTRALAREIVESGEEPPPFMKVATQVTAVIKRS